MRILTLFIGIMLFSASVSAQTLDYAAYLRKSLTLWETHINELGEEDSINLRALSIAKYGYLQTTMADRREDSFNDFLESTKKTLSQARSVFPQDGLYDALLSSTLGLEIAYSPMKGMYLGMRTGILMSRAIEKSPNDPMVLKLYGDSKMYTPDIWGGDKQEALEYYLLSRKEFEDIHSNHWIYLDLLANLGQLHASMGKKDEALEAYETALKKEPQFYYVGQHLLPKLSAR